MSGALSNLLLSQVGVSIEGLVSAVVYLIVVGGICWLLLWLVDFVALPAPFAKVARVIIVVVAVLLVINLLLSFVGHPVFKLR